MLSNALATGKTPAAILNSDAAQMTAQLKIEIHTHTRAKEIDQANKVIKLESGDHLVFSKLVLAVGADPIRLPLSGDAVDDILSVNDLDDYRRFREALEGKKKSPYLEQA